MRSLLLLLPLLFLATAIGAQTPTQPDAGPAPGPAAALVDWFKSLSDEQLAAPLPEGMEMFGANHATLAATMAWHEGVHDGQLIEVRRSLGLPRAFG